MGHDNYSFLHGGEGGILICVSFEPNGCYSWPGNIRELYHTLERTYLIGGGCITHEILASEIGGPDPNQRITVGGFQAVIDHAEKQLLQEALSNAGGNKTAAAAALNMKPSTFRDKLAKHGL